MKDVLMKCSNQWGIKLVSFSFKHLYVGFSCVEVWDANLGKVISGKNFGWLDV